MTKVVLKKQDGVTVRLVWQMEAGVYLVKETNLKENRATKNAKVAQMDYVILMVLVLDFVMMINFMEKTANHRAPILILTV